MGVQHAAQILGGDERRDCASFGAGNTTNLGGLDIGVAASQSQPNGAPSAQPPAGSGSVYEILFTNEQNNQKYQYLKLYNAVSGTTPSITYRAFMAVLPEE